ncbi:hypothetical protein O9929_18005 [Vibrio lentus]|nr:hypothetical protein [Vibrio lentus]
MATLSLVVSCGLFGCNRIAEEMETQLSAILLPSKVRLTTKYLITRKLNLMTDGILLKWKFSTTVSVNTTPSSSMKPTNVV